MYSVRLDRTCSGGQLDVCLFIEQEEGHKGVLLQVIKY